MDKQVESAQLIEKVKSILDKELYTDMDMNDLADLTLKIAQLNDERIREIEEATKQTSEEMQIIKGKVQEYETTLAVVEAFLYENGLYEQFLVFSEEVVQDFLKNQKPKLRLVK